MTAASPFGLDPRVASMLRTFFAGHDEVRRVWLFGSFARGDATPTSDLDLAVDAPDLDASGFAAIEAGLERLLLVRPVDLVHWQGIEDAAFRAALARERKVFWARAPDAGAAVTGFSALEMKDFQRDALARLDAWITLLAEEREKAERVAEVLRVAEIDVDDLASDFPAAAWKRLPAPEGRPPAPWSPRRDGAGRPIPNVCLKVPTGGGKTLLAAAAVGSLHARYYRRHTGVVLWIVPNEAIYRQTRTALTDRDHPYRQLVDAAGVGRVKILEKDSPLSRLDAESHLCVVLLMLQAASRRTRETLRFFRDRGNVHGFFSREDDLDGHWRLLGDTPNLDVYAPAGVPMEAAARQRGSIVKASLGNVMRLVRPLVVIDEGHHTYTETALATIDGFNPSFVLELSATPRTAKRTGQHGANVLVDVRGGDLDRAEMIKLPINLTVRPWPDWKACLAASLEQLNRLEEEARALEADTGRYLRPILVVQVERTGAGQRDSGLIHADHARLRLLQLGLREDQIAVKTAEQDDLASLGGAGLLSPANPVRAIITRQALQEGWDCPFAYVLCALAAGRNPRALTQLVGRILRQPHAARTGRAALDECYVFCHDAETGQVVERVKRSLETEGMGDLTASVQVAGEPGAAAARRGVVERRRGFERLRIFLPRVTWNGDGERRDLDYESDVLAHLDWDGFDVERIAGDWRPPEDRSAPRRLRIGLEILDGAPRPQWEPVPATPTVVDRVFITRAIADIVPNPWRGYEIAQRVVAARVAAGCPEPRIARSIDLLVQQMRIDLAHQRDALAERTFLGHLAAGRIEFRLRADGADYEIPQQITAAPGPERPRPLVRPEDGSPVEKSLFAPFYAGMLDNAFEEDFACYLDSREALRWWHRNVARSGYGLQGWRRARVYPDFVFVKTDRDGGDTMVVMETKGVHLANEDTDYKRRLLEKLQSAFEDRRMHPAGELELVSEGGLRLVCGLVFDENWKNEVEQGVFARG